MTLSHCAVAVGTAHAADMIPFTLPYDDSSNSIVSRADTLNAPAGSMGHITVGLDGHLYEGSERIRFLGFNLGAVSNFPLSHEADDAAARMAKFGINIVRLHQMDFGWDPSERSIFGVDEDDSLELDEDSQERLWYLVEKLKEQGIYVHIDLLCSRRFWTADGLPTSIDTLSNHQKEVQRLALFDEDMIQLQKDYAEDLLSTKNPVTNLSLAEDPVVAFIGINNENSLLTIWQEGFSGNLSKPGAANPVEMPSEFALDLRSQWNDWLATQYASNYALKIAWKVDAAGSNLIQNGDFSNGYSGWDTYLLQGADADYNIASSPFGAAAEVDVTTSGPDIWSVQMRQELFSLDLDKGYILRFKARATEPRDIRVRMHNGDGRAKTLDTYITLDTDWHEFEFHLMPHDSDLGLYLCDMHAGASYYYTDVEVVARTLPSDQSLDNPNQPISMYSSRLSGNALKDWVRFLYYIESTYYEEMSDFLRNDLNCDALLVGSQVGHSVSSLMAELDVVDTHKYWNHPEFPPGYWNTVDWTVENESMVNDDEFELADEATFRVFGKPFIMSEYDHPAPSFYAGEAPIMAALMGALQGWDGIMYFKYAGEDQDGGWDKDHVDKWFQYAPHTTKMANMILASNLFRRGDLSELSQVDDIPSSAAQEQKFIFDKRPAPWGADFYGMPPENAFHYRVGVDLDENHQLYGTHPFPAVNANYIHSANGEFIWDRTQPNAGLITIDTERTKVLLGYTEDDVIEMNGLRIKTVREREWQIIGLTSQDEDPLPLNVSQKILLIANGKTENTNMGWTDTNYNSVSTSWGEAPTLVEQVHARISLEHQYPIRVWALDETGKKGEEICVGTDAEDRHVFMIGEGDPTIWYAIEAQVAQ